MAAKNSDRRLNACFYDMNYQKVGDTLFAAWAKEQGAQCSVTGFGMLLAQAAESFRLWFGVRPQWEGMMLHL